MGTVKAVRFNPRFCSEAKGTPMESWDSSHDLSLIHADGRRERIGQFQHADTAALVGRLLEDHYNKRGDE